MSDKNLFLHDLAIVAIFKNEGKYLREWLDYHLLAGVEHFYLYNNDSSDDYKEILAPYVENNLVTLINFPGKIMQIHAYNDAIEQFKNFCRYMAFIDLDEFIFPKTKASIAEVVDGIFSRAPNAAALGINWQNFGTNSQDKANYNRGVLERFTRRAPSDWAVVYDNGYKFGNIRIKSIVNPRRVDYFWNPHFAVYFKDFKSVNSDGAETFEAENYPIAADKIVVNHYYTKSREEFFRKKMPRGWACPGKVPYDEKDFEMYDRNEVFDDGILEYRAARADYFSLESDADKIRRVEKTLLEILMQCSPLDAPTEFFAGKLETFLTCRALAEKLAIKIGNKTAEEYALVWIYQTLNKDNVLTYSELQLLIEALPEILSRPFPLAKKIVQTFPPRILFVMNDSARNSLKWSDYKQFRYLQGLLKSI